MDDADTTKEVEAEGPRLWQEFNRQNLEDGGKKLDIPKLEEANFAGTPDSYQCSLILTEGESAKNLVMSGLSSVLDPDYYGVFPLSGKMLNVSNAPTKQVLKNVDIVNLIRILGLQIGKEYDNVRSFRYGHLIIMSDQDYDGSHMRGLVINLLYNLCPSVLKIQNFLGVLHTPIVKAINKKNEEDVISFYTLPKYKDWMKSLRGDDERKYRIKYYKGLASSTNKECVEYFTNIQNKIKYFDRMYVSDGAALELSFNSLQVHERKKWLVNYMKYKPDTCCIDLSENTIRYWDFIHYELILHSMAMLQRCIPSVVDGLRPTQRKILFCAIKKPLIEEENVEAFCGYVSGLTNYRHGMKSLEDALIGMAQNHVGKNNINLLCPSGLFGSRRMGGQDTGDARYLYTSLSPITQYIFHNDDEKSLNLEHSGEPTFFVPIIPMILVNGCQGTAAGWSTRVPQYDPLDIIENIELMLEKKNPKTMIPRYRGFNGTIEPQENKHIIVTKGNATVVKEGTKETVIIDELPMYCWTQNYKILLEKAKFIKKYVDKSDDIEKIHLEVIMSKDLPRAHDKEWLLNKLKLTSKIWLGNMYLFNSEGVLKKYDDAEEILKEFVDVRLEYYKKRKECMLEKLGKDIKDMEEDAKFIEEVMEKLSPRDIDKLVSMGAKMFEPRKGETEEIKKEFEYLTSTPEEELWLRDLKVLKTELKKQRLKQ